MIFKTITDETTLSGQRIVGALQARKIAQQQATAQLEIDIACLKEYQVACQNGTVTTEQFDAIMHKASASAVEYSAKVKAGTGTAQSYANTQRATNSALQEVSIGAGIASKAVKLFSTALNMIAFTAIIQGISWLIGKVDEWIVTAKEAKESADAFKQSLSTFFNETQANLKTISSLSDRFDELSKNVDDNGKKVGGTEEEYAEFLDICQQVGQIMPELITGYTAEGEAIITLQGKVDSLTDSYKEAIKAKAALFLSNGDEEGNTIESFFEDYNDFVNGYQGVLGLKTSPSGQNTAEEFEEYYGYDKIHGWLSDVTDATLEDLGKLRAGTTEYVYLARVLKEAGYEISEISAENYNAVHDVFNNRMSVMEKGITDRVTNIRTAFQNMLYADSDYWKIDDENVISAINSLYASIDDEFIKQNELFNQTALQTFESDFVSLFNNDATKKAMVDFYTPIADDETVKDYADRIKSSLETVQSYCDGNGITVPINFDDSKQTINNLEAQYQRAVDFAKDKFDGYDPTAFFKEHSINTQGEIDAWQEIAQGARDATEAEKEYIQGSTLNENPIFSSFSDTDLGERIQHITNLFNEGSISHKEYFDALQSEINNFDASNFTNSIEEANAASQQFFTDSVQQTANGLSNLINKFDSGSIGISEYLEGYLSIAETMSTLTDELQKNSEAWDENGNALSNTSNSALDSTQENMANAISVIQSYQDSIYSLEQIMTGTIEAGSNEFAAHAEVIAEDLARIVATGGEMADEISNVLGTTTAEIAQSLTESVSNQSLASQAIAANTNTAIGDMANSIGELFDTLGNAISNFKVDVSFGIKKISTQDVDMGILGTHKLPKIDFALEANGQSLDAIGSAISSFGKTISSNLKPQMIELPDFTFGNTEAGKNSTYKPSPGITKNYEDAFDKIKESAKDASKSAKDSADDIKNVFKETFDFFDQRVNVLDDALSLLKTNLDNVTGSFAKNKLIDAELGVTEEKFKNYTDALSMYTEKANEALSKLPSDIAQKIKDGAVDLTTFIGDGNEEVVEAIKDYQNWADKIADCKQELAELKTAIRQLELEKFNNIMEDFTNQFDLHEDGKDLISKQIDLLKEAGQLIGESFFTTQIDQSKKQLAILEEEKAKLVEQLNSALSSGRVN